MVRFRDSYFAALGRRGTHRLRAALVVLHIAISVALVIAVAGMAQGLGNTMHSSIDSFVGSLVVAPKIPSQQGSNAPRALRNSDVEALQRNADPSLIREIVPVVNGRAVVKSGDRDYGSIGIVGSTSGYLQLKLMQLKAGEMFSQAQYDSKARVVLIGPKLVQYLFDGDEGAALGSEVMVGRQKFTVIGITSGDGQDEDTVLMPLTSSRSFLYGGLNNVVAIGALATNLDALAPATADIARILDRAHYVKEPDERDFTITSYTYLVPFMKSWLQIPKWFAAGATLALLFVGIFGLANLMLISVGERRSSIRYRRATGVSAGKIIREVLVGSTVIAATGAALGVIGGIGAILVARQVLPTFSAMYALGLPPIPVEAVVLSFVACVLAGLVSGAYPAIRAARIPVGNGPSARIAVPAQRSASSAAVPAQSSMPVQRSGSPAGGLRPLHTSEAHGSRWTA
jgi:putative ABC transport system permease protein